MAALPCQADGDSDLATGRLQIAGTRLQVSPDSQTVPFDTPTIVETSLIGFDAGNGALPADLWVVGDFKGPEIDGSLELRTRPGEPFRIPRLSLKGQYRLDDIRLVEGDALLAYASPRSSAVLVTQVLITKVTSRPLTLDEIRSYGIVVNEDSFEAFNFTFGFAIDGEVFDYNLPLIYEPLGNGFKVLSPDSGGTGSLGTTVPRFSPPQLAPFTLELESDGDGGGGGGGCMDAENGCERDAPISLPGVIVFPTDVALLHQFFSVVLIAKNDAPLGDPLRIRDLKATISLPPGLRVAQTEPPTALGVPVPVLVPGADGVLGTGDDLTFLVAQAEGQAEALVEGLTQGSHIVDFALEGFLEGLPGNVTRRIRGNSRGAVVVRDSTLGVTITHPDVVRAGEDYSLLLTVSNTSNAPVNLVKLSLPPSGLSGVSLLSANSVTIPTLAPGESEIAEFRLRSQRTGKVVGSTIRGGSRIDPRFEFSVGVGDSGIPLSPTAIILPRSTEVLPELFVRHALSLVGLGYSLATAPPSALSPDMPQLTEEQIHEKVYWLGQAGRHHKMGEDLFDSLAIFGAEWTGARDHDWEWDRLRRRTQKGALVGDSVGQVIAAEAAQHGDLQAFNRWAASTSFLGPLQAGMAVGPGVRLAVSSRASGQRLAGSGVDPTRLRELPFADLYELDGSQMAILASPEETGYRLTVTDADGGNFNLHLLAPTAAGVLRRLDWHGVALGLGGRAFIDYQGGDQQFTLKVDTDGDGTIDDEHAPGSNLTISPRPFMALGAVQQESDPGGHLVEILFSQDIDLRSLLPLDKNRFTIPGKVSNGGLVPVEEDVANFFEVIAENPFEGLQNTRIVRVVFDNPISPYVESILTVRDIKSVLGDEVTGVGLPVVTTVTDPGGLVSGTVYGPDGNPAPGALVELFQSDYRYHDGTCLKNRTAAVKADANGNFLFDYVRQTSCSELFTLNALDTASGKKGTAQGRVRFIGEEVDLDILMLGRGSIRGRVTYDDGTVPAELRLVAFSPVFAEGRVARITADGHYEVGDLPVGTISLAAGDGLGNFGYQTVEIAAAGVETVRDFTIFRQPVGTATGDVRGVVVDADDQPVIGAYVALYLEGQLLSVERSGQGGKFDFGTLPAGMAEIEAFDSRTGLAGAQVFFEIEADTVEDVRLVLRDEHGTVEGRVIRRTLAGDSPVVGAVVWVSGTPFNTLTDATGFYRLEGVFAGNRTVLAADVPRGVQTSAVVTVNGDGTTSTRDLVFVESVAGGLAGEVLGVEGNPVAGATIHLGAGSQNWWNEAITDATGRWVMPNLAPGGYTIYAFKGQVGAVGHATIRFQGETPFVSIRFKKGTIRGVTKVRNGDGQLVGVSSLVTYRTTVVQEGLLGLDWQERLVQTAADGTFEIPNVLMGGYVLSVSNAFHGEKTVRGELLYQGEVAQHEFVFEQAGEIRGVVYDWDGVTPLAGVRVDLRHPNFSAYDVTTDAEGKFLFALVPPSSVNFPIEAKSDDGLIFRQAQVWARLDAFGQELDVEIVMPRQGTVGGWVEDANGQPVAGAVVTLSENAFPRRTIVRNADIDGFFSFTNVFAGQVSLKAKAPSLGGLGAADSTEITAEGEEVFSLLVLEATGEVIGQVISPVDGQGVHAQVSLLKLGGLVDSVTTDEQGFFRFQLLRLGAYSLVYFDPRTGRHGRVDTALVEYPNHVAEVVAPLEVRGEVDGHLREPGSLLGVPGATIQLTSHGIMPFSTFSSTDGDGYFEFLGIPEGSFTLKSREPAGRRKASGAGEIQEEGLRVTVDLLLEASGRVAGTVLNPAGAPAGAFENVNVLIRQDGLVVGATLDNPFEFEGIIANQPFELQAIEIGGSHRAKKTGVLTGEGTVLTADFPMVPIGKATVSVVDASGNPVAGAEVHLRANGFYGDQRLNASSGGDGKAVFTGLGQGRLDAWARSGVSALTGSAAANLALENEMVQLTVQLESAGVVRGRVLLAGSTGPAVNALVVLTRGGRTLQTATDANGDFLFPSVPLGAHTVFVQEHFGPGTIAKAGSLASNGQQVDLGVLVLDDRDPRVTALAPEIGSTSLGLDTTVTIEFSEPLDRPRFTGGWLVFRSLSGRYVNYTVAWSDGDRKLQLTPNAPLDSFTGYEVIVQDAYDPAGRRLADRVKTVFTTRDVVAPTVIDVLPRNNQIQVPVATQIKVTFSEPVVAASLNGSAMQLTDLTSGQGITTTFLLLPGERQVLLTPATALATDHLFQLTLQGAMDGSGNTMSVPVSTRFTTIDTTPPSGLSVTFPAGTSFVSGAPVPVVVTATDANGVASAALQIGGWTFTDPAAPFEISGVAPYVAATSTVEVKVRAIDTYGNAAEVIREIEVSPRQNAAAPGLELSCGSEGEVVVPGRAVTLSAVASDDEAIESVRLLVDGAEIGVRGPFPSGTAAAAAFTWTPPAGAAAGQSFAVRFETRDFAGNVKVAEFSLEVASGTVLTGGRSLNATYDGQPLVLVSGTFVLRADLHLPSLHVMAGASLVAPAPGNLRLAVDGAVRVQCGGALQANGTGFIGGFSTHQDGAAPEGVAPSRPDAGGSHGGTGVTWNGAGPAGAVYDGVYAPRLPGGGGGHDGDGCCNGSSGGGVIDIEADSLVVQGAIEANGLGGTSGQQAGGAGGSIFLRAASFGGRGRLSARGGNGGNDCSGAAAEVGAGGGGRVAIWTGELANFDLAAQADVRGGGKYYCTTEPRGYAAAGTALVRSSAAPLGILAIDNGKEANGQDRLGPATELPVLPSGDVAGLAAAGGESWLTASAGALPAHLLGAFVELTAAAGGTLGSFRVLEIDAAGRALLEGAGAAAGAARFRGLYRFDQIELRRGAGLAGAAAIAADAWRFDGQVIAPANIDSRQLVVEAGAVVRAPAGLLYWRVAEKAEIRAGAKIDLMGAGYPGGGAPAWAGAAVTDAGGSHGGVGVGWNGGAGGGVYDSVYAPQLPGAGGSHDGDDCCDGSAGGGALILAADQVVLDGNVDARGAGTRTGNRPGGAGGAIFIAARSLEGAGRIDVSGGDGGNDCHGAPEESGAGGGGRVALSGSELLSFDPALQVAAFGGGKYYCTTVPRGYAAPGTVFYAGPESVYGALRIDSGEENDGNDRNGPATVLPTLGGGALSGATVADGDLWISRAGGFLPEWQGVWVVLLDAQGASLGVFEAADRRGDGALRLAGAAGASVATGYRGEYRFDRVELLHGAGYDAADPVGGHLLVLEGEVEVAATVTAENVVVRAGAVVRPAAGQRLRFAVTGTLTVEAGAAIDASGYGYAGGTAAAPAGQAPAGVAGPTTDAGGSHGGAGVGWNGGVASPVYDSVYAPRLAGGGGAHDGDGCCDGSAGGGIVEIVAGQVVLDGQLLSRGLGTTVGNRPGGAGGAVWLRAENLSGAGSIDVSGGAGGNDCRGPQEESGAGGGGRVSLEVGTFAGFDPAAQVKNQGGGKYYCTSSPRGYAAPGTTFHKRDGDTFGVLLIDSGVENGGGDRLGPVTALPLLGGGAVTGFEAAGPDAWLSGAGLFPAAWQGVFVSLKNAGGDALGTFRVLAIDAAGRLRLEGAAAAATAASYAGSYRFDRIDLRHGAGVDADDPIGGASLVLEGQAEVSALVQASDVLVKSGAVIRPAQGGKLRFELTGTLRIEAGARIDVSGLGFAGGNAGHPSGYGPDGVSLPQADAGGSHGGVGALWNGSGSLGAVYDGVYRPTLAGGGGAADNLGCCDGSAGGGVIEIEASGVVLEGEIRARGLGTTGGNWPGGAGGTVWLRADALTGAGLIDASGGDGGNGCVGGNEESGAGGGGRVALWVGALETFDPRSQVRAAGGGKYYCTTVPKGYGAPGTIFVKRGTDTYGWLLVDSEEETGGEDRIGPATALPALGSRAIVSISASNGDAWATTGAPLGATFLGAWASVLDDSGGVLGLFRIAEIDVAGRARLEGAGALAADPENGAASLRGEYRFDRLELRRGAGLAASDPVGAGEVVLEGNARLPAKLKAHDLTVPAASTVKVAEGSRLGLEITGKLEIETGGKLDLTGFGYAGGTAADKPGQAPAGLSRPQADAGGSHGGIGAAWNGAGAAGEIYDSVYSPTLAGGGGAHDGDDCCDGSAGGGILDLDAATVVLDGQILVRGAGTTVGNRPGGAGGTVWLRAGILSGAGSIDASGGDGGNDCRGPQEESGAGGGGRVALEVSAFAGFDPVAQVKAWGGGKYYCTTAPRGYGAPGTIYLRQAGDTYGRLLVDAGVEPNNTPRTGPATRLPTLGSGAVVALAADGADAWLEGAAPFAAHWHGIWVVITGSGGAPLGAFKAAERDGGGRLRLAGAAALAAAGGAAGYRGEYRFDRIELRRTAILDTDDPLVSTLTTFSGDAWLPARLTTENLTIPSGSTVRLARGRVLDLDISGTLTIAAGGVLDLSGAGYAGGTAADQQGGAPEGLTRSQVDAGGSHGGIGVGWNGGGAAGEIYDSVYAPSLPGGGGAHDGDDCCDGSAGGGVIDIAANAVVLDGQILSRGIGTTLGNRPGGAGGTLYLRAGSLTGGGSIDVSGGAGGNACHGAPEESGAGGGGRVAIEAGKLDGFDPVAQVKAWGGGKYYCTTVPKGYAAPGTVFVKKGGDTYGWLLVDAGAETNGVVRGGPPTVLPSLGAGALTSLVASGDDAWLAAAGPFPAQVLGAYMVLIDGAGEELGAFRVSAIDAGGQARLAGAAGAAAVAASFRGEYRFDRLELRRSAALDTAEPISATTTVFSGDAALPPKLEAGSMTIPNGSTVRLTRGSSLELEVAGTLTVAAGGKLDLSGSGFAGGKTADQPGQAPTGLSRSQVDAGGSHGGKGSPWNGGGAGGEVYDSVYAPALPGGGGSHDGDACCDGSAGGGALRIAAASVVVDGEIRALGLGTRDGNRPGGAGGTVNIAAASLSGAGRIDASGGDGGNACHGPQEESGAGGGGRVLLEVGQLTGFDPAGQTFARGGVLGYCATGVRGWAAPGTVLVKQPSQLYGDLRIDQGGGQNYPVPPTTLPAIGRGLVGMVEADALRPAAVWIEPQDPARLFSLGVVGMWTRIAGVDYPVIGLAADRRRILLAGAAGAVQVGQAYVGIYKFDQVAVAGNATLESRDGLLFASQAIAAGSSLIRLDIESPALALTSPAALSSYSAGGQIEVAATASDNVGVVSVTFRIGDHSFVDTVAPYAWTVPAPAVEAETQLPLIAEAVDAEANVTRVERLLTLLPLDSSTPPAVAITCPSPGAFAAIGSGIALQVAASHDLGIERVELLAGDDPAVLATDFDSPFTLVYAAPAGAADGTQVVLKVRARSFANTTAETTLTLPIVAAALITADRTVLAGDSSLDGQSVVVAAGTLTVEGSHSFRDLAILDGAKLGHPASTTTSTGSFAISVARDVFVSCGGQVDAAGRGYRGGAAGSRAYGYPNSQTEGAAAGIGGSHGGRGGSFDGSGAVYGSVFDPADPGAGGGSTASAAGGHGGGVIRLAALGKMTIDGVVSAKGATGAAAGGAGGSIRLDAASLSGQGSLSAAGAAGAGASNGGGSGGRIALYAASIDTGLLGRSKAPGAGNPGTDAARWGAAGTVFAKLDGEPLGSLILDNDGLAATQLTELPAPVPGIAATVDPATGLVGDPAGSFPHSLAGAELAFGGELAELWTIESHSHRGQSVELDVDGDPLTAQAGDGYEVVYRFGSVELRGGARGLSLARVVSASPPVIGAGSSFDPAYAPQVAFTSPAAHAQFASGSQVAVSFGASTLLGVRQVILSLGASTTTLATPPFTWTAIAPAVTTATPMQILAVVEDRAGHRHRVALPIEILPPADPTAPLLTLAACPTNGELVAAGSVVNFAYQASDDQNLQHLTLSVDGVVVETRTVGQASASGSFNWSVPAAAVPGTSFVATVAATDYAGNVTSSARTLATPTGTLLAGGGALGAAYDGQDVVLTSGSFTASGPLHPRSLAILRGASLTRAAGSPLALVVDTELQVRCGGAIDLAGRGYAGGSTSNNGQAPAGSTPAGRTAGGAHGGKGIVGIDNLPAATAFDSVYLPSLGGGGGGRTDGNNWGGAGGGVAAISAATVLLDGEIRAMGVPGQPNYYAGSGAGGSVTIHADLLRGVGKIDATGGDYRRAGNDWGGPGAGGRIALWVDDLSGFDLDAGTLYRGGRRFLSNGTQEVQSAGGTLYVMDAGAIYGDLWLDNESAALQQPEAELVALGGGAATAFEIAGADAWLQAAAPGFLPHWTGVWVRLADAAGVHLGTYRAMARDANGRLLLAGAAAAAGTPPNPATVAAYIGEYRFDRIESRGGGGLAASDPLAATGLELAGQVRLPARLSGHDLTVKNGAKVTPVAGGELEWTLSGELAVEAGATIDVSGRGFAGGSTSNNGQAPAGSTPAGRTAGGAHGGKGIVGIDNLPAATAFDSVYLPSLGGGGGGRTDGNNWGGAGGGVIAISAAKITLDGQIKAAGVPGTPNYYAGSGAGGTILLRAGELDGAGLLDASGGDYQRAGNDWGGPGAGGRIALWIGDPSGFDLDAGTLFRGGRRFFSHGGLDTQSAGGTLYLSHAASTYGELVVDNESALLRPEAELVALGGGQVELLTTTGAPAGDAWLTSKAGAFAAHWAGVWVRLADSGGQPLGSFRATRRDSGGRLLLAGASGAASSAFGYLGEYKFDRMVSRNGGGVYAADPLLATASELSGLVRLPAKLAGHDLTVRAGATVAPVAGGELNLLLSGTLTIESTGAIDLSGRGFAGGSTSNNGQAPSWATPAGRTSGGGHGGKGPLGLDAAPVAGAFDSVYLPSLGGGGGGRTDGNNWGGAGGGVIAIEAAHIVLDGKIKAAGVPGAPNFYAGSGAGGSVVLRADTLTGAGQIDVTGGNYQRAGNDWGGPGAGGRLALWVDDLSLFDLDAGTLYRGGRRFLSNGNLEMQAASGTLYTADATATYGDLYVDAESTVQRPPAELVALGGGAVAQLVAAEEDGWLVSSAGALTSEWVGTWVALRGADGAPLGAFRVADRDVAGRLLLANAGELAEEVAAGTFTGTLSYAGEYRFDKVLLRGGGALVSTDKLTATEADLSGPAGLPNSIGSATVRVRSGATVSPVAGRELRWTVSGTLTVESGAAIELSGRGYAGGSTSNSGETAPGVSPPAGRCSGGGHGGAGTVGIDNLPAAAVFDSLYWPLLPGGGGGRTDGNNWGGAGGGVVHLTVGTLQLDGQIRARGVPGAPNFYAGSGAGGTILIEGQAMAGGGVLDVSGGGYQRNGNDWGGPGAGGRIALYVAELAGYDLAGAKAAGGRRILSNGNPEVCAAPGTIYVAGAAAHQGELILDGDATLATPATKLPAIGAGSLATVTADLADPADAWVEAQTTDPLFELGATGAWLRIGGADYRILGQSADRKKLLLENAAATVTAGQSYAGVHKLKKVTLRGSASLSQNDVLEVIP